jgi:hypothetical protein
MLQLKPYRALYSTKKKLEKLKEEKWHGKKSSKVS